MNSYKAAQLMEVHREQVDKNHDFFEKIKKLDIFYLNQIVLIFMIFLI